MNTVNTTDSPIVSSPIVNSPISGGTIITDGEPEFQDFNPCCAAGVPAGSRMFYFKFVFAMFTVVGGGLYGLFRFCEYMGWF